MVGAGVPGGVGAGDDGRRRAALAMLVQALILPGMGAAGPDARLFWTVLLLRGVFDAKAALDGSFGTAVRDPA